jgi:glycosyltransferase involved in cell wall biosynthesis
VTVSAPPRRIGYVLSQFPCYDETFILREIKALAERGVVLRIFSLRTRKQPVIQEDARRFLADTRYAAFLFSFAVIGAVARTALTRPAGLLWALGLCLRAGLAKPSVLVKLLALLPKTLYFAEVARQEGLGHLHAHWATYPATSALIMSRLAGVSFSFTCHAHDIFLEPHLLPEKLAVAEFVLTCTANNKEHLETLSPRAREIVQVSYHGLDVSQFEPRTGAAREGPVEILGVGSLLECKGFAYLIRAAAILRARGRDIRVTIAGGGPLAESLRALAAECGVADIVRFTGYVTQKDLVPLYRGADLFALPAVLEIHWGIPNVLVEAAACALPIVTTALPSLPELLEDGVHGLVARNKDATDLAEKLDCLAGNAGLRRRMGLAGRRRVEERFDVRRTIESVIEPLLQQGREGARSAAAPATSVGVGDLRGRA